MSYSQLSQVDSNDYSKRKYSFVAPLFLMIAVGFLLIGLALITVWGIGFSYSHDTCLVLQYQLVPGQYCPWPDSCVPSYCVNVYVNYFGPRPGEQHKANVFMEYGDRRGCWTTENSTQITEYLTAHYPIGSNQTCYSGRNHGVHFFDHPERGTYIFFTSIGLFSAMILSLLASAFFAWRFN